MKDNQFWFSETKKALTRIIEQRRWLIKTGRSYKSLSLSTLEDFAGKMSGKTTPLALALTIVENGDLIRIFPPANHQQTFEQINLIIEQARDVIDGK